jgi:hypothetical protein
MRSPRDQFLTLSQTWMNSATAPEGFGHDLLVGQRRQGRRAIRRVDGREAPIEAQSGDIWVHPTGGGYFFTPAASVLASLPP